MPAPSLSLRGRSDRPGARIVGLGAAQPSVVVRAEQLGAPFGKTAEWLRARTGIVSLRRLAPDEDLLDLSVAAASEALEDAELDAAELDTVLVASCTGTAAGEPPLARRVAARLAPRSAAFDVNAVCAGFCYALGTAANLIGTGVARAVLVVGAEQMSTVIDPADLGTSILFGDGAGAAVVASCPPGESGVGPLAGDSDGSKEWLLRIPPGEKFLRMHGREVFRWAVDEVHRVAAAACAKAGLTPSDVDVFVPHQANVRIVDAMARRLGLGQAVIARDVTESGNTSAASIPIALAKLRRAGRTRRGQVALLVGFGAGLSTAAQVVTLP